MDFHKIFQKDCHKIFQMDFLKIFQMDSNKIFKMDFRKIFKMDFHKKSKQISAKFNKLIFNIFRWARRALLLGLKGPAVAVEGCSPPQELEKAARRAAIFLVLLNIKGKMLE